MLDTGSDLVTALHERYVAAPDADIDTGGEASEPGVHIIFVGNDHIRAKQQLNQLFNVSVKGGNVSSVGASLGEKCPHLVSLDMRENLLWNTGVLGQLGGQLASLETLNLGGNALQPLGDAETASMAGALPSLAVLILSHTGLSWRDICSLSPVVPALQELHVCDNSLRTLEGSDGGASGGPEPFASVHTLALTDNELPWEELARCGTWPALQKLHAAGNAVTAVLPPGPGAFQSLTHLTLTDNPVTEWSGLDALDAFPCLSWLRAVDLPLYSSEGLGPSQARMHLVGRLACLDSLNGSTVRRRERADCEKSYLKLAAEAVARHCAAGTISELLPALAPEAGELPPEEAGPAAVREGGNEEAVQWLQQHHPRFFELSARYRDSVPTAVTAGGGASLAGNTVNVTLRSMAGASSFMKPVQRALPLSLPVSQLATVAAAVFRMEDAALLRLSFRDSRGAFPTLMEDPMKPLSYYGVADGGEVLVEEVEQAEAERLAAVAAEAAASSGSRKGWRGSTPLPGAAGGGGGAAQ